MAAVIFRVQLHAWHFPNLLTTLVFSGSFLVIQSILILLRSQQFYNTELGFSINFFQDYYTICI